MFYIESGQINTVKWNKQLGSKLKTIRKLQYTRENFSTISKISYSTLEKLEQGTANGVLFITLLAIANGLKIDISEIYPIKKD